MGAYNKYKGEHCCHNRYLLNDILKRDWAFDGVVVSDWGGTHDTKQAAENGLDMEFGSWTDGLSWGASNAYDNYYLAAPYLDMLRKGEASTATLDDKARRVLRLIFRTAMNTRKPFGSLNSPRTSGRCAPYRRRGHGAAEKRGRGAAHRPRACENHRRRGRECDQDDDRGRRLLVAQGAARIYAARRHPRRCGRQSRGDLRTRLHRRRDGRLQRGEDRAGFEREPFRGAADRRCPRPRPARPTR